MPTIVGILTFISVINTTSERLKARNFFIWRYMYLSFYKQLKFRDQLSWAWKKFYNLGAKSPDKNVNLLFPNQNICCGHFNVSMRWPFWAPKRAPKTHVWPFWAFKTHACLKWWRRNHHNLKAQKLSLTRVWNNAELCNNYNNITRQAPR